MPRYASTFSLSAVVAVACSTGASGNNAVDSGRDSMSVGASAGNRGTGGESAGGARGTMGSGAANGSGGAPNTGGSTQMGGASSSGGTAGTGGASATGGNANTGGTSATGGTAGAGSVSYTTNFDLTESPLSENAAWHHVGADWTLVDSGNGIAFGTQALGVARSGPTGYNDSYAYLSGFPPDYRASAVIHLGTVDTSCTHEVEVLMRWADSAHLARGYECNLAYDGSYAQIVRWNGAVGDFTYLGSGSVPGGVHDGDTLSASVVGNQITLSVNGVVTATAQDSTFATGNPGIGLWRGSSGCGSLGDYGFTSFTATSIGP